MKIWKRAAALTLALAMAGGTAALAACAPTESEHEHTFSDEWSYNDTNHWHEATCGHDLRADEGAHTFETVKDGIATSSVCTICGLSSSEYVLEAERT